ncbi:MAG: ComEA family DNA-binding protein [Candidatus Atribacteria bacterium]|nr:ComEA family DNA-binding protein [Candidatus Atribacteria bacterium]
MFNLSNQEKITIIFLLIVIIIGIGIILYKNFNNEDNLALNSPSNFSENNIAEKIEVPSVIIHISGAVKNPGVYQLKSTDRVVDAVEIAGGITERANPDAINLAALLKDGQKIIIPYKISNQVTVESDKNISKNIEEVYSSSSSPSDQININTADDHTLQSLPGIGPVLSQKIIDYRNQNGLFEVIDDIKDVSGIGEKKFEGIKDLICVQ